MNVTTRYKSIKERIRREKEIQSLINKEITSISLTKDELEQLAKETNREPQEILDNGYDGTEIFILTYTVFFGAIIPAVTKKYE